MVKGHKDWFAAEVYKSYLYCAAKIIRARGGIITAYDGDRVMGVFIGDSKNTDAAKCGPQINWASKKIVTAKIAEKNPKSTFVLKQRVGIDTSKLSSPVQAFEAAMTWCGSGTRQTMRRSWPHLILVTRPTSPPTSTAS